MFNIYIYITLYNITLKNSPKPSDTPQELL